MASPGSCALFFRLKESGTVTKCIKWVTRGLERVINSLSTMVQSFSTTHGYDGLAFDLSLEGKVKGLAIIQKGRTVVLRVVPSYRGVQEMKA